MQTRVGTKIMSRMHLVQLVRRSHRRSPSSVLVPIDMLPDEILEHIFILGYEDDVCRDCGSPSQESAHPKCTCPQPFKHVVASVSCRWRAVALDSSCLWTTVRVTRSTTSTWLRQYLGRSRVRPIDVQLVLFGGPHRRHTIPRTELESMLKILMQHLNRWRRLDIVTPYPDTLDLIMSSLSNPDLQAPLLEVLEVECPLEVGLFNRNGNTYPRPFPNGAPRLQHVHLYRCRWSLSQGEAMTKLTAFSVASAAWTLSDLHYLATTSPGLTHLSISSSYRLEEHVTLHFPSLHSLRVGDYYQNSTILRLFSAPELEVLQIEDMEVQSNVTAGWYVDALRGEGAAGKFPKLRSLRLQMPGLSEDPSTLIVGERFRQFLGLFPSIVHLAFVGLHVDQFVQGLISLYPSSQTRAQPEQVLLPNLQKITLGGEMEAIILGRAQGVRFFKAVTALVLARKEAGAPLRKVQLPQVVLRRNRYLPRKMLIWALNGYFTGVKLEGMRMPYPPDIWIGSRWGLHDLREQVAKSPS